MSFVNHHVLPVELLEYTLLPDEKQLNIATTSSKTSIKIKKNWCQPENHLVASDNNIPASRHHHVPDERVSRLLVADQTDSPT